MTFSKLILKSQGPCYKVEESAFSHKDAKLLNLYMSKTCSHDVSLVSNEEYEWDENIYPEIALSLVKTCKVPRELDTEKIYFFVIEFAPVFPQFKLTASYFEKFSNLASLSLCEYYFDDVDVVSMFSKIPFLQFLFLKYCNVEGRLQEILDTCFNLHTMRLIHCNYDTSEEPIKLPKQMLNFYTQLYEPFRVDISRCEKTLEQLEFNNKYYPVEIITSHSLYTDNFVKFECFRLHEARLRRHCGSLVCYTETDTPESLHLREEKLRKKMVKIHGRNADFISYQSSPKEITPPQSLHLRKLNLRCYLKYPGCFGESLESLTELTVDWIAIYNYATIGSSTTNQDLKNKSRHVNLKCIIHLDMYCVVHPSSEYDLVCTFTTAMKDGHCITAILKWSHIRIETLSLKLHPRTLRKNPQHCLIKRRS